MINGVVNWFKYFLFQTGLFLLTLWQGFKNIVGWMVSFITLYRFKKASILDTRKIDKTTDKLFSEFDAHLRSLEVVEEKPRADELKSDLLYAMEKLNTEFINSSNPVYEKIQNLEAIYSKTKSELDNKLYYELKDLEHIKERIEEEIAKIDEKASQYEEKKEEIEGYFNAVENKRVIGDLSKVPAYVFWLLMIPAGFAEFFIYQNVFLSQEIGLMADAAREDVARYRMMAGVMSTGFIIMIIWMAHALGKLVRHLPNTTKHERKYYWAKIAVILFVSLGAIWATVDIRGKMHTILAYDQKVRDIKVKQDKEESMKLFSSDQEEFGATDSEDDGFGGGDDQEDAFGDETESDDGGFGDEQESTASASMAKSGGTQPADLADVYREKVNKSKEETAMVFMLINLFIFIGGAFLSFFAHTSSPTYEMILDEIKELEHERDALNLQLQRTKKHIMWLKKYQIDPLFKRLLKEAALYDLQVRVYNGYIDLLIIKLKLIENYLRNRYSAFGVEVPELDVVALAKEYIALDDRKELHHVDHIEEYMIYNYANEKKTEECKNEDV